MTDATAADAVRFTDDELIKDCVRFAANSAAISAGFDVVPYNRDDIGDTFGATTDSRHENAEAIGKRIAESKPQTMDGVFSKAQAYQHAHGCDCEDAIGKAVIQDFIRVYLADNFAAHAAPSDEQQAVYRHD